MFCNECGKEVNEKAVVCIHCGCKVSANDDSAAVTNAVIMSNRLQSESSIWSGVGRIGRVEFLKWQALTTILAIVVMLLSFLILPILLFIPLMWISTTSTIKRFHDLSLSGWWILACIGVSIITLGLAGYIVFIVLLFIPGKDGANTFGESIQPQKIF